MGALKKVGHFNDLPVDKLAPLPKPGTIVSFKVGEATYDPVTKTSQWKGATKIPARSVCFDPYWKDTEGNQVGRWVELCICRSVDPQGMPQNIRKIWAEPNRNAGHLNFTAGTPENDEAIQYIMLISENGKNQYRDSTRPVIVETVDHEAEANKRIEDRTKRRRAIQVAAALESISDVYRAALLLGINISRKENVVRDDIENMAETQTDAFLKAVTDPYGDVKATIVLAIQLNTVKIDHDNLQLRWAAQNTPILNIVQTDLESVMNQFAAFVTSDPRGEAICKQIQSLNTTRMRAEQAKNSRAGYIPPSMPSQARSLPAFSIVDEEAFIGPHREPAPMPLPARPAGQVPGAHIDDEDNTGNDLDMSGSGSAGAVDDEDDDEAGKEGAGTATEQNNTTAPVTSPAPKATATPNRRGGK